MHINKNKLFDFIQQLKKGIDAKIMLLVDAMFPCNGGSSRQYAICQWIFKDGILFFTDFQDGHCPFCTISVNINDSIITNMESIHSSENGDLDSALLIMTHNIDIYNKQRKERERERERENS